MSKRHPIRNSQVMMAILDIHSFFQEESLKLNNNQPILPHIVILERVYAVLKISEFTVRATPKKFQTCISPETDVCIARYKNTNDIC
jgi:hypothetical protein